MPLYEYVCTACGARFELLTSWTQADAQRCPSCGAEAQRLVSSFASRTSCEVSSGG